MNELFRKIKRSIKNGNVYLDDGRILDKNGNLVGFYDTVDSIDETCTKVISSKIDKDHLSEEEFKSLKEIRDFLKE